MRLVSVVLPLPMLPEIAINRRLDIDSRLSGRRSGPRSSTSGAEGTTACRLLPTAYCSKPVGLADAGQKEPAVGEVVLRPLLAQEPGRLVQGLVGELEGAPVHRAEE